MEPNSVYLSISLEEYQELVESRFAIRLIKSTMDTYGPNSTVAKAVCNMFISEEPEEPEEEQSDD